MMVDRQITEQLNGWPFDTPAKKLGYLPTVNYPRLSDIWCQKGSCTIPSKCSCGFDWLVLVLSDQGLDTGFATA